MRGTTVARALRELESLPLRRESLHHIAWNGARAESSTLNRLIAADPALALAALRFAPRAVSESKAGVAELTPYCTPRSLLSLAAESIPSAPARQAGDGQLADYLWMQAVATAHAARQLARIRKYRHPQAAFIAGLLHDLGMLAVSAVISNFGEEDSVLSSRIDDLHAATNEFLGRNITSVARQLAKRWSLPSWLVDVIAWWQPSNRTLPRSVSDPELVAIVRDAVAAVNAHGAALEGIANPDALNKPWRLTDPLQAVITRGVRQAWTLLSDCPDPTRAESVDQTVTRMLELVRDNSELHARADWRLHAWELRESLPADTEPAELTAVVAETFALAVDALATACYVRSSDGTSADGSFFRDSVRPAEVAIEVGKEAKHHSEQFVAQLPPMWRNRPFRVVDLDHDADALAHVLLWLDDAAAARLDVSLEHVTTLCTSWMAQAARATRMESEIEELTDALREQAAAAEARLEAATLEAMAEMSAGAGHEINNPLAVISGRAQLLLAEESDPRRRKSLETIVAQAQRIHRMIVELMFFARPPEPDKKPLAISDSIDRALAVVKSEADRRGVNLTSSPSLALPLVEGDVAQLAMAVECILHNAVDAAPNESGHVAISVAASSDAELELRVTDNGPGLTAEQRSHMFEPFYSGREAGRGLGMGLSKAWRIVANHAGTIDVETGPGGTTVVVRLPISKPAAEQRECA